MVLPQAMAWVQYWFRVLSLKFCGKSKKNCGDISQLSPAFCMYAVLSNFLGVKDLLSRRIWAVFICHGFWIPKSECSKPEYNIWFNTSESGVQILNFLYIAWFGDHILWSDSTACSYGKLFGRIIFFDNPKFLIVQHITLTRAGVIEIILSKFW